MRNIINLVILIIIVIAILYFMGVFNSASG